MCIKNGLSAGKPEKSLRLSHARSCLLPALCLVIIGKTQVAEFTCTNEMNRMVELTLEGMSMCALPKAGLMCIGHTR